MHATYRIVRFFQGDDVGNVIVKTGVTLAEAQAHCNDPESSSITATSGDARNRTERNGPWFDGYEMEVS